MFSFPNNPLCIGSIKSIHITGLPTKKLNRIKFDSEQIFQCLNGCSYASMIFCFVDVLRTLLIKPPDFLNVLLCFTVWQSTWDASTATTRPPASHPDASVIHPLSVCTIEKAPSLSYVVFLSKHLEVAVKMCFRGLRVFAVHTEKYKLLPLPLPPSLPPLDFSSHFYSFYFS